MSAVSDQTVEYTGSELTRGTNWWGAFVIGLAGTILVTGIAPLLVTNLGATAIPTVFVITMSGVFLIFLLAEMSAMMPDRTGGSPTYAYPGFKIRYPRLAPHVNGATCWAYWLGWFPVAPLNGILASYYIASLFGVNITSGFTPINTFVAWSTFAIAFVLIAVLSVVAYLGIRFGTIFATVLAMMAMIPLTFLTVAWMFKPSIVHWSELAGFPQLDGAGFFDSFANFGGHAWWFVYIGFSFTISWNVIAYEAAACYIGECRNPERDGPIAMTVSGAYGLFIYMLLPIGFIVVLGATALSDPSLVDPQTMFVKFAGTIFPGALGEALDWGVAIMLIVALALSALNALMGSARGLYQMAVDGDFLRWFTHVNKHGVPGHAMLLNTVASFLVIMVGGAAEIYTFSNVGYIASFVPTVIAYYLLRKYAPEWRRPFRLPEAFKYIALLIAALYTFIWIFGGIFFSIIYDTLIYYILGWVVLLAYLPLYYYRIKVEDPKYAREHPEELATPEL